MNFGGGMNMQNLMKQAQRMQAEMQENMEKAEAELESTELTGTSGGGMVEVTCTGKKKITQTAVENIRKYITSLKKVRYGRNQQLKGKVVAIEQYACDFYGNKVLVKKIDL